MENWTMGTTIASKRREYGMTQEALANRLGVSNQAVSKWESDQCCPDVLLLPKIADEFHMTIDALFGREPAAPEEAAPEGTEQVVLASLPWADNDDLHAVCFVGHRLVGHTRMEGGTGTRGGLLGRLLAHAERLPEAASVALHFSGSVRDIYSDFAVVCSDCGVAGNVTAGDGATCGDVGGSVTAGDSVTCGDVGGSVTAGDGVTCCDVGGSVKAGDSVKCGDVGGSVAASDSVTCGNVEGDVTAGDGVSCGDIGGDAKAGGSIRCTAVGGDTRGN